MAPSRKGISLHLGLNAVDPGHYAGWAGDLNACEADAKDMLAIATQVPGFEKRVLLLTKDATRQRVIGEIQKAAAALAPGDLFLLTYSGHGGQVPDRNGDEDDFQDETWCLHDGQLIDDELYQLWRKFPAGSRVLMLSDSCHSGSVFRKIQVTAGRAAVAELVDGPAPGAPRYRAMPMGAAVRTYQENKAFYDGLQDGKGERGNLAATVRLLSGCQDDQLSSDGAFNGLFTATLLRVWRGGAFKGDYARFHRAIKRRMPPDQAPKHSVLGQPSPEYDAQTPFTV